MSAFFRAVTETVPSLFHGIFSEQNSVPNPNHITYPEHWLNNKQKNGSERLYLRYCSLKNNKLDQRGTGTVIAGNLDPGRLL